jgi:hypothetical protein
MANFLRNFLIFLSVFVIGRSLHNLNETKFFDNTPVHLPNPFLTLHILTISFTLGSAIYRVVSKDYRFLKTFLAILQILNLLLISPSINHIKSIEGSTAMALNIGSTIVNSLLAYTANTAFLNQVWVGALIFESGAWYLGPAAFIKNYLL